MNPNIPMIATDLLNCLRHAQMCTDEITIRAGIEQWMHGQVTLVDVHDLIQFERKWLDDITVAVRLRVSAEQNRTGRPVPARYRLHVAQFERWSKEPEKRTPFIVLNLRFSTESMVLLSAFLVFSFNHAAILTEIDESMSRISSAMHS